MVSLIVGPLQLREGAADITFWNLPRSLSECGGAKGVFCRNRKFKNLNHIRTIISDGFLLNLCVEIYIHTMELDHCKSLLFKHLDKSNT